MNESLSYKKIVLIVVVVSAIMSLTIFVGFAMWTGLFTKSEKLEITDCLWADDLDTATILIKNIGETTLRISQLRINNALLNHEEWVCYPSNKLESGDEGYVYVSSSIITFEEASYYTFELTTESGKTFVHTFATPFTFSATEQIEIQGCAFSTGNVTLTVQNTGTADLTVSKYKIGTGGTPTNLPQEVPVAQGATESVTAPLSWTSGTTYDIYLITSTGKQFPYRATAP